MRFTPPFCPYPCCRSGRERERFSWSKRGRYLRKCDGRMIPRFQCQTCGRSFSSQTFRISFRYRKPLLHLQLLPLLYSKVTRRQAARILAVNRKTVDRRLPRMARVAYEFHLARLEEVRRHGGMDGVFQLDELETFEEHRKLKPVTMSVLIERRSYFVLHSRAGALPARRPLSRVELKQLHEIEDREGVRHSESDACVRSSFRFLSRVLQEGVRLRFQSDLKVSYPVLCKQEMPNREIEHETVSSKKRRDRRNLLFPINHTLAMLRDGVSCLVRRSWGACKKRENLQLHVWIWTAYRNYVRGCTVRTEKTPAQIAGVSRERYSVRELFQWRWPKLMPSS